MKFESAIIYQMPISQEEMYIRSFYETLDIKKYYKRGLVKMFDIEKLADFYADLKAKREEAIAIALANKDVKVAERFELEKEKIAQQVEAELIAEAEAPFKHDIELCEKFLVEEKAVEEVAEEIETNVEGE